ncbi:MAG: hypothetical protein JWM28_1795, partial [Chitinophagaceae bacterium]|nr:hypothetical protein [Chitinophagaceae bacterium]
KRTTMKKFINITWIILLIVLTVAVFTKPGYDECISRMNTDLTAEGYFAGWYISHDKKDSGTVHTPLTIKDRIFYREIFFHFDGEDKKIAIAAFSHFYKIRF